MSNDERKLHPVNARMKIAVAMILKKKIPGLSYDYIYDGEIATLGDEIRAVLGEKPSAKALPHMPLGPAFEVKKGNNNNDGYRPPPTRRKAAG
jgi:hypothetical protein